MSKRIYLGSHKYVPVQPGQGLILQAGWDLDRAVMLLVSWIQEQHIKGLLSHHIL